MKIAVDTIPLEVGGVQIEGEFTIKNSAKAFGILSGGLYSNKPAAILRELGANAYDSHVEAGKPDLPFTVHLPTRLNPTLSIRDYGIGLDHRGVTKLYTTYFESTKTNSNDMIGCLGLGSKTPFSYTRNFTVVAIHNGVQRTYAAFINDAGIPAIALMGECATDECNGLEVSFAVNKDDINTFANEATKVYRWFKVKPTITGNAVNIPDVTFEERDIAPGSHLANISKSYYDRGASYAIMGNIAYPISIPESVSEEDLSKEVRALFTENSFVIEVGIGELDIAASREELSYVKLTIDTLRKRGEEILKGLEAFVNAKVAHLPTKWERTEELGRLVKTNSKLFGPTIEFYVKRNTDKVLSGFEYDYYGAKVKVRLEDVATLCPGLRLSINEVHQSYRTTAYKMQCERNEVITTRQNGQPITSTYASIFPDRHNIVLHDGKGSANQRVKAAIAQSQSSPGRQIVMVQALNKTVDRAAEFQRLLKFLGDPPANRVFYTSNMPRTGAARGENLKTLGVLSFEKDEKYSRRRSSDHWNLTASEADSLEDLETVQDKDGNDVYLYVPLMHKKIMRYEGAETSLDMDADTFVNRMEHAVVSRIVGFAPQNKVYGIKRTSMHLVKGNSEWKNFWDFLEESFDAIDWNTAREKANNAIRKQAIESSFHFEKADAAKVKDYATRSTPFGKLAAAYMEVKAFPKAEDNLFYERLVTAMHSLYPDKDFTAAGVKVDLSKARSEIETLIKEVKKTYPLLAYLGLDREWNADAGKWREALTYMEQVDTANR